MRQNDLTVAIFSGVAVVISILFPLVLRWRDEWHKRRLTAAETLRNEQDKVAIDTKHAAALLSGFVERYPAIQEHLSFLGAFKGDGCIAYHMYLSIYRSSTACARSIVYGNVVAQARFHFHFRNPQSADDTIPWLTI